MIARHDNLRGRECLQKLARFLKLALFRALRKIAGNHNDVRPGFADGGDQSLHGGSLDAAEVRIRQMSYGAHFTWNQSHAATRYVYGHDDAQSAGMNAVIQRSLHSIYFAVRG